MQDMITNPPFNPIGSLRNENVERPGRQKMATENWDFLSLSALTRQIGQRKLKQAFRFVRLQQLHFGSARPPKRSRNACFAGQ